MVKFVILIIAVQALTADALKCYTGMEIKSTFLNTEMAETECGYNEICMLAAVTQSTSGIDIPMTVAMCSAPTTCTAMTCDAIKQQIQATSPGQTTKSCEITCCSTPLCRDNTGGSITSGGLTPPSTTPSSITTAVATVQGITDKINTVTQTAVETTESGKLKCYTGMAIKSAILNTEMAETVCGYNEICMLTDVIQVSSGIDIPMTVGMCTPAATCAATTCAAIIQQLRQNSPGQTTKSCKTTCCSTPLCKDNSGETIQASPQPVTISSSGSAVEEVTNKITTATGKTPHSAALKCYSGMKMTSDYFNSKMTQVECKSNEICSYVDVVQTNNGMTIPMSVGFCQTKDVCSAMTCDQLEKQVKVSSPNAVLESCKISCCEEDLCTSGSLGINVLSILLCTLTFLASGYLL